MVMGDLMMTWHVLMEEDPCTLKIWPLEAQRLPQQAQRLAIYAKTSPLGGMMSSFRACLFCKIELYFVKGKIRRSASLICVLP
jgi:hypothetical protein